VPSPYEMASSPLAMARDEGALGNSSTRFEIKDRESVKLRREISAKKRAAGRERARQYKRVFQPRTGQAGW
jgi:hypothetical protein